MGYIIAGKMRDSVQGPTMVEFGANLVCPRAKLILGKLGSFVQIGLSGLQLKIVG